MGKPDIRKMVKDVQKLKNELDNKDILRVRKWRKDPVLFVKEALRFDGLTLQQIDGLRAVAKLVRAKIMLSEGKELPSKLSEIKHKIGVSIMAGRGVGKDTFAAMVILWFMFCFPFCKILCTGPSEAQLKSVLWSEIAKWLNQRDEMGEYIVPIRDCYELTAKALYWKDLPQGDYKNRWFAEARTVSMNSSPDEQAETLAGRHEDYMLYLVDEASGVPDAVRKPFSQSLTGKCNICLEIFNPTRASGYAYRTHFGKREDTMPWIQLHWDAEQSDIVSKAHIEALAQSQGKNSNAYIVGVKGLPPRSDEDTVIPHEWVYEALQNNLEPLEDDPIFIGVDVAMGGGDNAVIAVRKGPKVLAFHRYPKIERTDELGTHVLSHINEYEADMTFIEINGIGRGVYDFVNLYARKGTVFPVDMTSESKNEKCYRLRDDLWWRTRTAFEKRLISLPKESPDVTDILVSQLSTIKYENSVAHLGGKLKVESKQKMRGRECGSPDDADALIMTFMRDYSTFRLKRQSEKRTGKNMYKEEKTSDLSWMLA